MKKLFYLMLVAFSMFALLTGCTPKPPPPIPRLSQMRGQIALLTLNPLPSIASKVEDLGFNALMPYSRIVFGWKGKLISIPNRSGVFLRFTSDEPDCRGHNPVQELAKYHSMKAETPDIPVGLVLCQDIGCGLGKKDEWIEIAKQVDFIAAGIYSWDKRWTEPDTIDEDALKRSEEILDIIREEIGDVPFVPILQAHWGFGDLVKPNVELQVKFFLEQGYEGYIVYCWADEYNGVRDEQEEWEKWNKWFLSQIK